MLWRDLRPTIVISRASSFARSGALTASAATLLTRRPLADELPLHTATPAEGEGFEPSDEPKRVNGFEMRVDFAVRPLQKRDCRTRRLSALRYALQYARLFAPVRADAS